MWYNIITFIAMMVLSASFNFYSISEAGVNQRYCGNIYSFLSSFVCLPTYVIVDNYMNYVKHYYDL